MLSLPPSGHSAPFITCIPYLSFYCLLGPGYSSLLLPDLDGVSLLCSLITAAELPLQLTIESAAPDSASLRSSFPLVFPLFWASSLSNFGISEGHGDPGSGSALLARWHLETMDRNHSTFTRIICHNFSNQLYSLNCKVMNVAHVLDMPTAKELDICKKKSHNNIR